MRISNITAVIAVVTALICVGCTASEAGLRENVKTSWVTNTWTEGMRLYELGEFPAEGDRGSMTCIYFAHAHTNIMWLTNTDRSSYGYGYIDPPPCSKGHLTDYPKSNSLVTVVQRRVETAILRGSKELFRTVRYEQPRTKIVETTIQELEIRTNMSTRTRPVTLNLQETTVTNQVWVEGPEDLK